MRNQIKTIIQTVAIVLLLQACGHGPYKGRLVDEGTGQPVAGAVAVGYWTHMVPSLVDAATKCLDAREAVSDGKGEFTIPTSAYGEFFGTMNLAIYKVGYEPINCEWASLKLWGGCMAEPAEWDGNRAIIPLRKVPKEKLHTTLGYYPSTCRRRDGKPLSAFDNEIEEYLRVVRRKP